MPAPDTDKTPQAFFQAVLQTFQEAEGATKANPSLFFKIAGHTIRLRFAGDALVPLITPALKHLASKPTSAPALTVCLWDSRSTGAPMPPPSWSLEDCLPPLKEKPLNLEHFNTIFHQVNNVLMTYQQEVDGNILNVLDKSLKLALFWTRDAGELPYWEIGAPLRYLFSWWVRDNGLHLVHAGAVGTPDGGVLLAGKGGSGKSSTALTCIDSDLVYVSDDYCLLSTTPLPYIYSVFSSAKLDREDIERFPYLTSVPYNIDRLDREKAIIFLNEQYPEKIAPGFPIRAVLIPRVTGRGKTVLKPASAMEGLKALAPSSILQLPGANQAAFRAIAGLVRQVPCYNLELGTVTTEIPEVISRLLSKGAPDGI